MSGPIKPEEMPPCEGNPNQPCRNPIVPTLIAGFDDKFRCVACNRIHIALVDREAGSSEPNATQPKFVSPRLSTKAEAMRRKQIFERYRKIEVERPTEPRVEQQSAVTDEERRLKILAKYGKRSN